jgi:hypothetical protein
MLLALTIPRYVLTLKTKVTVALAKLMLDLPGTILPYRQQPHHKLTIFLRIIISSSQSLNKEKESKQDDEGNSVLDYVKYVISTFLSFDTLIMGLIFRPNWL